MKTTGFKLIIISTMAIIVGGCLGGSIHTRYQSIHAQFTSMNIGCNADDVKISNERIQLNGAETWTATCGGKIYDCDYFPDADSHCFLRDE